MENQKGLLHIYTGDGKGKTTAAMGLALRSAGCGKRVVVVQFLKGGVTGEIAGLQRFDNVTILRNSRSYGFVWNMEPSDKACMVAEQKENLTAALKIVAEGDCDLLVLDELIAAYMLETVDQKVVCDFLESGHGGVETVLTGRNAPDRFMELADYVTEMRKIKHPFDAGVSAREGVEF